MDSFSGRVWCPSIFFFGIYCGSKHLWTKHNNWNNSSPHWAWPNAQKTRAGLTVIKTVWLCWNLQQTIFNWWAIQFFRKFIFDEFVFLSEPQVIWAFPDKHGADSCSQKHGVKGANFDLIIETRKNPVTDHYASCLTGILIMVQYWFFIIPI